MTDAPLAEILERSWAQALEDAEARHGSRPAFHFEGEDWHQALTFTEWLQATRTVAAGLAALGVQKGHRVAALAPGSAMWPILQTACSHLGAIIVPVNTRYRQDEVGFVLGLAEPDVIVLIASYHHVDYVDLVTRSLKGRPIEMVTLDSPVIELVPAPAAGEPGQRSWAQLLALGAQAPAAPLVGRADDAVLLQFTSGTSAFPKGRSSPAARRSARPGTSPSA
ncbi:AMP-binding protein [Naasia aerilata]|uniref:AMP-dependent synthetase/ligase domain-containing protein n=1 Tax=Naasia aerilata TaxID=1162966 RepID=A0ABN6XKP6_9MICO|nr:hypothetical protein GCM10025866_14170 [Naasia aerilata]